MRYAGHVLVCWVWECYPGGCWGMKWTLFNSVFHLLTSLRKFMHSIFLYPQNYYFWGVSMVAHCCNSRYRDTEVWRIVAPNQPGQKLASSHLNNMLGMCFTTVPQLHRYIGRTVLQSWPWAKAIPSLKDNRGRKGCRHGLSSRVLLSKSKSLSSNHSNTKKI
jgi:hypothetical protein